MESSFVSHRFPEEDNAFYIKVGMEIDLLHIVRQLVFPKFIITLTGTCSSFPQLFGKREPGDVPTVPLWTIEARVDLYVEPVSIIFLNANSFLSVHPRYLLHLSPLTTYRTVGHDGFQRHTPLVHTS